MSSTENNLFSKINNIESSITELKQLIHDLHVGVGINTGPDKYLPKRNLNNNRRSISRNLLADKVNINCNCGADKTNCKCALNQNIEYCQCETPLIKGLEDEGDYCKCETPSLIKGGLEEEKIECTDDGFCKCETPLIKGINEVEEKKENYKFGENVKAEKIEFKNENEILNADNFLPDMYKTSLKR